MKKVTPEAVAKQLSENVSIEFINEGTATYFFHIDEEGNPDARGNISFNSCRDVTAYAGDADAAGIYETETLENNDFRAVCEDLADQANIWISGLD